MRMKGGGGRDERGMETKEEERDEGGEKDGGTNERGRR